MTSDLLEKSRVIKQAPGERSYHIFYQIMSQKKLRDRFNLEEDIHKYHFSSQAEVTVPGMDDKEEWRVTDNSFDVMSFSEREKDDLYKGCAAIMHMGNMKFKQKPREEQGEVDGMERGLRGQTGDRQLQIRRRRPVSSESTPTPSWRP